MLPWLSSLLSRLLIDRKRGHRRLVLAALNEKQRVAGLSAEEQERYRCEKLVEMLNHARAYVPFWREKMEGVGEITAGNAREVLRRLPEMGRREIQEDRRRFEAEPATPFNVQHTTFNIQHSSGVPSKSSSQSQIANQKSQIVEDATGGSSGTPMRFLVDRATQIARESSLYWADSLAGWKYGDRIAMLWGSDKDNKSATREARLALRWWLDNRRWFNAFNMGEDRMAGFHASMSRFKPHLIVAYAGSLEVFAKFLRDNVQHSTLNSQRSNGEEVAGCRLQVEGEDGVGCSVFGVRGRGEEKIQRSTLNVQHSSGGSSDSSSQSQIANKKSQIGSQSIKSIIHPPSPCGLRRTRNPKSKIPNYPLTALVSSAEVLTPQARELIESVFGRPVFNRYGNREFGALATEDGKGGLVVNPVDCIVEIDSPDPVNVPGAIVVTYLWNKAMPFIRYNTGDLGVWVEGEEGSRIARIQGREGDTIRTRNGKMIHGEYFTHLMYRAKGVREFQFVQESLEQCRLLLVADELSPDQIAYWRREIAEVLGNDVRLEIVRVDSIPLLSSGKRKFTISHVTDLGI